MESTSQETRIPGLASSADYASKAEGLQRRVNGAAQALAEKGIRPTVTRIRAALGGGSPNDLAPALKHWKESVGSTAAMSVADSGALPRIPIQIADLAHELWQRANAAAVVELKGGIDARSTAIRSEEAGSLRSQVSGLRDQLQRESLAFGELRAQAARYEAMAHSALSQAEEAETRERKHLRVLGAARQRIAELEAKVNQPRERRAAALNASRRHARVARKPKFSKQRNAHAKTRRTAKAVRKKSQVALRFAATRRRGTRPRSRRS